MNEIRIDALSPQEMATRAENLGVSKVEMPFLKMFMLAIMAGAFIALGAIFATTIGAGSIAVMSPDGAVAFSTGLPYGVTRLLMGLVFSLGLILVVVGGAELFTGNSLIVMAWANGKVKGRALLRNWVIVYLGNFVGAIGTAALMFFTKQYTSGSNAVGVLALKDGGWKSGPDFRSSCCAWRAVQWAGMSCCMADLQRPQHDGSNYRCRLSHHRICCRWL